MSTENETRLLNTSFMVDYMLENFENGTFWSVKGSFVKPGKDSFYLPVFAVAFQWLGLAKIWKSH